MNHPKMWVISDSHFNHEAIKPTFEFRPEWFEEQICRKIKNNIWENDILIHLWDVIFKRDSELNTYLDKMWNCKKILVRGNHDKKSLEFYLTKWFDFVVDEFKIKNIIFSHIPKINLEEWEINIHWHLHTKSHHLSEYTDKPENYILYSAEKENYMPAFLNQFLKKHWFEYWKHWVLRKEKK